MLARALRRIGVYGRFVRFSHTLFALPFALASMLLAAGGLPSWRVLGWILAAMLGARTAGMAWNRIADRRLDARNPRTCRRELVTGEVSLPVAVGLTLAAVALFELAAWQLGPLAWRLSPVVLAALWIYPLTKRFTDLCHFFVGLVLALAPVGAWVAVRGALDPRILWVALAVWLWVTGFDVIYATQDLESDRREGVHSMVVRLGLGRALAAARWLHVAAVVSLGVAGVALRLHLPWYAACCIIGALVGAEHALVRPADLSRVNLAFFRVNVAISLVTLAGAAVEVWLHGPLV